MEGKLIPGHSRTRYASKIPTKTKEELKERGPGKKAKPSTVGARELKENQPPSVLTDRLASSGPMNLTRKTSIKSMGYLEMKRMNQELVSEVEALHGMSEEREAQHLVAIRQLAEEITEHKRLHEEFKGEIKRYKKCLAVKNKDLDTLRHNLEEIKLENERLATILEGARLDAATGLKIDQGADVMSHRHKMEMDVEGHHRELDGFITSLESTISLLQEQELNFEVSLVTR